MGELLDEKDWELIEAGLVEAGATDDEPDGDPDDIELNRLIKKFMDQGMPRPAAEQAAKKALAAKQGSSSMSEALREALGVGSSSGPDFYALDDQVREAVELRESAAGNPTEFYRRLARERQLREAVLTAKKRSNLKSSDFAIPPDKYPIHDESHARNALTRVAQHGTPEEQAKVKAAVRRRYPNIDVS